HPVVAAETLHQPRVALGGAARADLRELQVHSLHLHQKRSTFNSLRTYCEQTDKCCIYTSAGEITISLVRSTTYLSIPVVRRSRWGLQLGGEMAAAGFKLGLAIGGSHSKISNS